MNSFGRYIILVFLLTLLTIGFFYRFYGLNINYSFWADEASTARFGRTVLSSGVPKIPDTGYISQSYLLTHYLIGLSFKIFGLGEFAARLPSVVFGTLTILAVFFLGDVLFNKSVGLASAVFMTFSYVQIAWSRQARGYAIFELFFILSLYFICLFFKKGGKKISHFFLVLIFILAAILTHPLGFILIPIAFAFSFFSKNFRQIYPYGRLWLALLGLLGLFFQFSNLKPAILWVFSNRLPLILQGKGFLSYYHSLFWRQYPLFSFFTFFGLITAWFKKKKDVFILLSFSLLIYLFTASFLLHVPFEKYILAIFPLFFITTAYSLYVVSEIPLGSKTREKFFLILAGFIIFNGNKFTLKPRRFYTLNFDMREIPEADYKGIYSIVRNKSKDIDKKNLAVVDIDEDMPAWYLGEQHFSYYNPRNDMGKQAKSNAGAIFIHNLEEFKNIYQNYKYGFVVLLEHNFRFYPEGLVDFVRKNLYLERKEQFAWFSPGWNSWPIELYSWGFQINK